MSLDSALCERLAARLGPAGYSTDPDVIAPHLVDWRARPPGSTPFLAMPASAAEVADVVRLCAEAGVPITPQGGNTGLVGGQIPEGELLLSLKRMTKIRAIDADDDSLAVEAGATLVSVHDAAASVGRLFPLSLGSQGSATIGGLISTNAGGVHVVRYGMMRDLVLGLEVVLPDGVLLNGLKTLRKDNTGYDLKQLFIGAEGTLGVITAASLRLFPKPADHVVAVAGLQRPEDALVLLHRMKARTGGLAAFELMNRLSVDMTVRNIPGVRDPLPTAPAWIALIECEGADIDGGLEQIVEETLGEAIEQGLAVDAVIARSEAQAKDFWRLRETIPAAHRVEGPQAAHDISVPVSAVPAFLAQAGPAAERVCPGARIVAFGHAGDGNIHYSVLNPKGADTAFPYHAVVEAVQAVAHGLKGSISAEHGIGVARRDELPHYKDPVALQLMKTVKAAIDPKRIMNPRAMLTP